MFFQGASTVTSVTSVAQLASQCTLCAQEVFVARQAQIQQHLCCGPSMGCAWFLNFSIPYLQISFRTRPRPGAGRDPEGGLPPSLQAAAPSTAVAEMER